MAKRAQLTAALPKLAVRPELRDRVARVADLAECGMSDIVRDCIEAQLPSIELELGVTTLEDFDDVQLAALGLARVPEEPISRAAGCFGGPA